MTSVNTRGTKDPKLDQLISLALNQAGIVALDDDASESISVITLDDDVPKSSFVTRDDDGPKFDSATPETTATVPDLIMKYLSYEDISTCALVSKSWNRAAMSTLKSWHVVKLRINFIQFNRQGHHEPKVSIKMGPLNGQDRSSRFYTTIDFECLQEKLCTLFKKAIWLILDLSPILDPEFLWISVKLIFEILRPFVTRLILDGCYVDLKDPKLDTTKFMLLDSPNLRHLYFRNILNCELNSQLLPEISLPEHPLLQVRTVRFQNVNLPPHYHRLISDILKIVPNVNKLYNFPLHSVFLLTAESLTKIKSISYELKLSPDGDPNAELEILSGTRHLLQLENLVTTWSNSNRIAKISDWRKCYKHFSVIMLTSQHTLRTLEIHNTTFAQYMDIPQIPALKTLILVGPAKDGSKFFRIFQKNFDILLKFPNLTRLEIIDLHNQMSHLEWLLPPDIFPPTWKLQNSSSTLKELKVRDYNGISKELIVQLASNFPQVVILDIGQDWHWVHECLPTIWKMWPNLVELTMEILWTSEAPTACLDEIFTGIPEDKCKELRAYTEKMDIDVAKLRSYSSIADLKNLKKLTLCFLSVTVPTLSHVTLFYGFHLVPNLEVLLTVQNPSKDQTK